MSRRVATGALRALALTVAAAAAWGFAIGIGKNATYAWRSAVKVPLLLAGTSLLCGPSWLLVGLLLGQRLPGARVLAAAGELCRGGALLLGGLAPVSLFLACTLPPPGPEGLDGYQAFVTANIALVAVAGIVATARQSAQLFALGGVTARRARAITAAWLLLTLGVGGQLAFWLRPFFGIPSLTGTPPFALGDAPTATGARNFYEVVWQTVAGPDVEVWRRWRSR